MSSKKNPYLRDPKTVDVMNTLSAVLLAHGKFNEKMFERFKKLFDDAGLKWWIILAGVGGLVEALRIVVDGGVFLWTHYHY
jgi:hypothetical protein